jgi:hypothetical protein
MLTGADQVLQGALAVWHKQDEKLLPFLDDIPAPLYVTDTEGVVTYFNKSCVAFTGPPPWQEKTGGASPGSCTRATESFFPTTNALWLMPCGQNAKYAV